MIKKILFTILIVASMLFTTHVSLLSAPEPTAEKNIKTNTDKTSTSIEKKPVETAPKDINEKKEKEPPASFTEEKTSLYSLFKRGGPFMWPILLFFALALGFKRFACRFRSL